MSAAAKQLRRHAELLHDLGAEPEEAHLQAFQLVERLDLLAEPAGRLGADAAGIDRHQIMLGVDLLPQLVAAAEPLPGYELSERRAERHRREEGERGILAGVIAGRRPARLDRSLGDRIEALERRNERTGLEEFHLELAAGHAIDVLGEAHPRRAKVRERAGKGTLHLPTHLVLGVGGGDHEREGQGGYTQDPKLQQASRHLAVLPCTAVEMCTSGREACDLTTSECQAATAQWWGVACFLPLDRRHDGCCAAPMHAT